MANPREASMHISISSHVFMQSLEPLSLEIGNRSNCLMVFYCKEMSVLGHGLKTASRLQRSTPHNQLLIQTSYISSLGLLLFTIGFFLCSWLLVLRTGSFKVSLPRASVEILLLEEAWISCPWLAQACWWGHCISHFSGLLSHVHVEIWSVAYCKMQMFGGL